MIYYTVFYEKYFLKGANAIIVVNKRIREEIKKKYRVEDKRIHFLYNGIDIQVFKPDVNRRQKIREKYAIKNDDRLILMVSTISRQKGFHVGIKAFAKIIERQKS